MQNVQIEERRSTRKYNVGATSSAQGNKMFKWNKGSGNHRARLHPAKLPTCKKELKNILSSEGNDRKLMQM